MRGAAARDFAMLRAEGLGAEAMPDGPGRSAAACEALAEALGPEGLGWAPRG